MQSVGKILRDCSSGKRIGIEYRFDGWRLAFGPSKGNRGMLYIALETPRGTEYLGWVKTRAEVFAWVEDRIASYKRAGL